MVEPMTVDHIISIGKIIYIYISCYSDGQLLRTSFGKKSENRHSGDVLSMGFKKSS